MRPIGGAGHLSSCVWGMNQSDKEALRSRTYNLARSSRYYDYHVVWNATKRSKRCQDHLKTSALDHFVPVSIVAFLPSFNLGCVTTGIHEEATMWLHHSSWRIELKDRSYIQVVDQPEERDIYPLLWGVKLLAGNVCHWRHDHRNWCRNYEVHSADK